MQEEIKDIEDMLCSMNYSTNGPTVLSHQYFDPGRIAELKVVTFKRKDDGIESVIADGFQIMSVLVMQRVVFAEATTHEINVVLVKLKAEPETTD